MSKKKKETKAAAGKDHVKNHPLKKKLQALAKKMKHPFDVLLDLAMAPGKLAVFAALSPLVAVMQNALNKKGVKVLGNKLDYPENLARQFYQVVILKGAPLTQAVGLSSKHLENLTAKDSWSGEIELEHADKHFSGNRGFNHDFSRSQNQNQDQDNNFDPSNPSYEQYLEHLYGITHSQKKHVLHKHGKKAVKHLEHWEAQVNSNLENLTLENWETQYYLDLENLDILKSITGTKTAQKIIHSKHHKHHKKHLEHLYGIHHKKAVSKNKKSLNKIKKHLEHVAGGAAVGLTAGIEAAGAAAGLPPALTGEAIKIIQAIVSFLKGLKNKAVKAVTSAQTGLGIPLTADEKTMLADSDDAQDDLAQTSGGTDSKGDTYFTNDNGEVSHVLHADGTVSETGAKPSADVAGRKGLFAWFYNLTHKKTDTKTTDKK